MEKAPDEKHGPWFPHRFRAERARQLVRDYGFDALLLKQFFNMARIDTPLTYVNPNFEAVKKSNADVEKGFEKVFPTFLSPI